MKTLALLLLAAILPACTVVYYPSGRKFAAIGSNANNMDISGPGVRLKVTKLDNAIIIQKVGAGVSQGIMSSAGTVVTGGIIK